MKISYILCAFLLLVVTALGETSLLETGQFIHLRSVYDGNQDDYYIRAAAIDAVEITRNPNDEKFPFSVKIVTRIVTTISQRSPDGWPTFSKSYQIECASRDKAEKVGATIVQACSGRTKNDQAEQAGADQPATKPAKKPPVKDKPSTPTSKDAPR